MTIVQALGSTRARRLSRRHTLTVNSLLMRLLTTPTLAPVVIGMHFDDRLR